MALLDATAPRWDRAFPPAERAAWRARVEALLKGTPWTSLWHRTADGLAIDPLPEAAPDARPLWAEPFRPQLVARMDHPDPFEANRLALDDLEGGADALLLAERGSAEAGRFGLDLADDSDLDAALAGIALDGVALHLAPPPFQGAARLASLGRLADRRRLAPEAIGIAGGLDPLSDALRLGGFPEEPDLILRRAAREALRASDMFPRARPLLADGRPVHAAGGTPAQELATVIASLLAHLRALEGEGLPPPRGRNLVVLALAADQDLFGTIAKLRALRLLVARLDDLLGMALGAPMILVSTARRMLAARDTDTNILRNTVAAVGAVLGGATALDTVPHSAPRGLPDGAARRLARNTGLILLDEAHLGRTADATAGAAGLEAWTAALAATAWSHLQRLEATVAGTLRGLPAAVAEGWWQAEIAAAAAALAADVVAERLPILGVSLHPETATAEGVTLPIAETVVTPPPLAIPIVSLPPIDLEAAWTAARADATLAPSPAPEATP